MTLCGASRALSLVILTNTLNFKFLFLDFYLNERARGFPEIYFKLDLKFMGRAWITFILWSGVEHWLYQWEIIENLNGNWKHYYPGKDLDKLHSLLFILLEFSINLNWTNLIKRITYFHCRHISYSIIFRRQ